MGPTITAGGSRARGGGPAGVLRAGRTGRSGHHRAGPWTAGRRRRCRRPARLGQGHRARAWNCSAAPLVAKLGGAGGRKAGAWTRGVAGSQVGFILGFLSGKVLGQFDPLGGDPARPGRLLLVAPNIVKVERELAAEPHRFPAVGVPAREHPPAAVHRGPVAARLLPFAGRRLRRQGRHRSVRDAAARRGRDQGSRSEEGAPASWIESIQSPEQRVVFDQLMALMTLLEGHATHVMDAVGPTVVPSVATISASFSERRQRSKGPIDRLLRALLGMDMKLAQYVKGARVRRCGGRPGRDGVVQRDLDVAGDPADPRGDRRSGGLGSSGARLTRRDARTRCRRPRPRELAGRAPARPPRPVIVACSGGADSLALALPARRPGAADGPGRRPWWARPSTTACSRVRPPGPPPPPNC